MFAAVTVKSRQRRMIDFYNLDGSKYILIGRTSAWQNELLPPMPTGDETSLDELIGGKLVQNQWYVKMLNDPTQEQKDAGVYYKGLYYYKTTDTATAISEGCTGVMLYVGLDRDELPLETYRQVGVQTQVQHSAEIISASQFEAIADKGILEIIENRKPQTRAEDQQEDIYVLVQF